MDELERKKLKEELLGELSEEISDQVEDEVEEEVEEELQEQYNYKKTLSNAKLAFIAVAATIMSLGQFSEAVILVEDGINWVRSKFSNQVEFDLLSQVHVGNTTSYMDDLFGSPQVSRTISEDVIANYYYDEKYLLTLFIREDRVEAFTVIPLKEDFHWTAESSVDRDWQILKANYKSFPGNPKMYVIDHSATASYYIESLDTGRNGLFVDRYIGNVATGVLVETEAIVSLYNEEVNGTDESVAEKQAELRDAMTPNFYGSGRLDLTLIQKSLLTGAEFTNYFDD